MTAVGLWLLVIGVCDLLRATRDSTSWRRRGLLLVIGLALLAFGGVALQLSTEAWMSVWPVWLIGFVAWVVASSLALDPDEHRRTLWRAVAFAALAATVLLLVLLGGAATEASVVSDHLAGSLLYDVGTDQVLLYLGVGLFELSSANLVVRLLLDAVGVPAVTNEKKLKGGRLLGPMERLFILVLGLSGELGAAAVVVAAKGLLRFPELQRTAREEGPTDVSEYFLIGSFASWLIALAGLVVVRIS